MPHYKLKSPANPNAALTKRGSNWDSTIYQCESSGTFWMLHMNRDGKRFLYPYHLEKNKPTVDKSEKHAVPEDWTGDPETIFVTLESVLDSKTATPDAVNLAPGFLELIDNGDRLLVTNDNIVIGELARRGDVVILQRKDGFDVIGSGENGG